jgi:preprotein translocase subunit SecA
MRREGVDLAALSEEDPIWLQALADAKASCEVDRQEVVAAGGLHVLGTERHEARRIDNQLRGRSGRQGDPGSSRFYIALEDDLMRRFGGQSVSGLMDRLGMEEDVPIEHGLVSKAIENAQVRVEGYNFDIRKHVLEYDDVVNKQREIIYSQRRQILSEPTMRPTVMGMVEDELRDLVSTLTGDTGGRSVQAMDRNSWDLVTLAAEVAKIFPLPKSENPESWRQTAPAQLADHLVELADQAYDDKEATLGPEMMRQLERLLMLRAVDSRWVRHLTDLDELREGIGLRAYGQQDPLVAYKREAHEMYQDLVASVSHDIVSSIYHAQIMMRPPVTAQRGQIQTNRGNGGASQTTHSKKTLGRNDPCWCGSGKKYKVCHMRSDQGRGGDGSQPSGTPAAGAKGATVAAAPSAKGQQPTKGKPVRRR